MQADPESILPAWFVSGGPVMWPLLGCSVIGLTFILERAVYWLRRRLLRDDEGSGRVLEAVRRRRVDEALDLARVLRDPVGRIFVAGLEAPDGGQLRAMEAAGREEVEDMKRFLGLLDTVITVAPLFGILGTVTGIISCFNLLGGGAADNQAGVMLGLAEALITTVAGLVIAIPAICFYNYFQSRVEYEAGRLQDAGTRLELLLGECETPKVEIGT